MPYGVSNTLGRMPELAPGANVFDYIDGLPDGWRSVIEKRFMEKVEVTGGCWIWKASLNANGYGKFGIGYRIRNAHQVSYAIHVGRVPDGLILDHLCRVRECVNPAHLEPVTQRTNLRRGEGFTGVQSRQTHCKYGHPLSGCNLYLHDGHRYCRLCRTRVSRERRRP